MKRVSICSLWLSAALGCAPSDGTTGGDSGTEDGTGDSGGESGSSAGDTGGDGDTGGNPAEWSFGNVYGLANLDDDNNTGTADWWEFPGADDDDRQTLVIRQEAVDAAPAGATVRMTLSGDLDNVRIWDGTTPVLGQDVDANNTEYTWVLEGVERAFEVEFGNYLASANLVIALEEGGTEIASDDVRLLAAPLILNHHLQPAEHVFATDGGGNGAFISGYQSVLGSDFTGVPSSAVGGDVWMQDEIQPAVSTAPGDQRLDTIIDSIRDRGLDDFAEDFLEGPDVIVSTWGPSSAATTYDSFGNLEVAPPVTVDGVEYPFGRIYYGSDGASEALHWELEDFLASQQIQQPFALDTSWLCVGHVDEFSSFVPDPSSEKGFKLLLADVNVGYQVLESFNQGMALPQYQFDHGYATVGDLVNDGPLRAYNQQVQANDLDPIRQQFKAALGLDDSDIILVPSLFEEHNFCRTTGDAAALIPGMVNLIVTDFGGETRLFVPDPFFRSGSDQSSDPLIADFVARMPAGTQVTFLDDWNTYHLARGEVHCGTNVLRTPAVTSWWSEALHLLP